MQTYVQTDRFTITFDPTHQAISVKYLGELTYELTQEVNTHLKEIIARSFTKEFPINIVADLSDVPRLPFKVRDMGPTIEFLRDDHIYYLILVVPQGTAGKMMEFMGSVITRMSKTRFRVFSLPEEAFAFLESPSNPYFRP